MDHLEQANRLLVLARTAGAKITLAESCTAGLLAGAITDVAGASDIFERGFVTYSNAAKIVMLGVSNTALTRHGAVSEQVAVEMAQGALLRADATIALSITGIAGPGGSEHKPEGRVCFALAQPDQATQTRTVEFGPLGRQQVRTAAVAHALEMLIVAAS